MTRTSSEVKSRPIDTKRTIFHHILRSDLPETEKTVERLTQDGVVTVAAGIMTTAWALSVTSFHILSRPDVLRKLKDELDVISVDPGQAPCLAQIERLPYLTACIKEGLRLSHGVTARLSRVRPDTDLVLSSGGQQWRIPAGTPVSMSSVLVHMNSDIFEDPHSFHPERWLAGQNLDPYLVAFSSGSRQCIGMNLAYAELYLGLAIFFKAYGTSVIHKGNEIGLIQLFETSDSDVEMIGDGNVPMIRPDSKGIRITVMPASGTELQ